jgi:hypothetical protein
MHFESSPQLVSTDYIAALDLEDISQALSDHSYLHDLDLSSDDSQSAVNNDGELYNA